MKPILGTFAVLLFTPLAAFSAPPGVSKRNIIILSDELAMGDLG